MSEQSIPNQKGKMKTRTRELALLAVGFVIGAGAGVAVLLASIKSQPVPSSPTQPVSQADADAQRCFNTLLAATAAGDYDQFVSVADDTFRSGITPAAFHSISQSLAPRMQRGYTPTYLGQLQQGGAQVSLWHLTFADGSDDRLARMSMSQQDRIDGFLITPAF
jgi:hypothetical protein